jgi:hypothetical protein
MVLEFPSLHAAPSGWATGGRHTPAWHAGVAKHTGGAGQSTERAQAPYWDGWKRGGARGRLGRYIRGASHTCLPARQVTEERGRMKSGTGPKGSDSGLAVEERP